MQVLNPGKDKRFISYRKKQLQTGSWAHPASYSKDNEVSFLGIKAAVE
jgi:hypothetical protein